MSCGAASPRPGGRATLRTGSRGCSSRRPYTPLPRVPGGKPLPEADTDPAAPGCPGDAALRSRTAESGPVRASTERVCRVCLHVLPGWEATRMRAAQGGSGPGSIRSPLDATSLAVTFLPGHRVRNPGGGATSPRAYDGCPRLRSADDLRGGGGGSVRGRQGHSRAGRGPGGAGKKVVPVAETPLQGSSSHRILGPEQR